MRPLDDETLGAYIDGEMDGPERAALAERIAADPHAALRLARLRAAEDTLRQAIPEAPTLEDDPLADLILSGPDRKALVPLARATPALLAVACLLVGGLVGRMWQPSAMLAEDRDIGLVASGELARRLDSPTGGRAGAGVHMVLSFKTAKGQYCRQFADAGGADGVACRRDNHWAIVALQASAPVSPTGYRMASGDDAPAVEAAIDALGAITVLDAAAEQAAVRRHWR